MYFFSDLDDLLELFEDVFFLVFFFARRVASSSSSSSSSSPSSSSSLVVNSSSSSSPFPPSPLVVVFPCHAGASSSSFLFLARTLLFSLSPFPLNLLVHARFVLAFQLLLGFAFIFGEVPGGGRPPFSSVVVFFSSPTISIVLVRFAIRDGAVRTKIGFSVVVSVGGEQTVEERFQFRVERSRGEVFLFLLLLCIGRRVGHFDFAFVCVIMRVKWKWRKTSAFCSLCLVFFAK